MSSHLFVVNNDTFGIHLQNNFLGVVMAKKNTVRGPNSAYYGQLADLMNVRKGDIAFLYLNFVSKNKLLWPENKFEAEYHGIYKIKSEPFISERDVPGIGQFNGQFIFGNNENEIYKRAISQEKFASILPVRMLIEPMTGLNYAKNVDDTTAYVDKTDEGQLWTLLFKKIYKAGLARGITPLLPEEASKVARLLFKANQIPLSENISLSNLESQNYPFEIGQPLNIDLESSPNDPETVRIENMLVGWIMQNIDKDIPVLDELVGKKEDLEFKGNHIQYGISGDTVDILLLHRRKINGIEYRYKATVIEVKKDKINEDNVDQALRYTKWIAQLVTFNNVSAIQPVVIGKYPNGRQVEKIKAKIKNLNDKGVRTPIFIEYKLHGTEKFTFSKFELQ